MIGRGNLKEESSHPEEVINAEQREGKNLFCYSVISCSNTWIVVSVKRS
jgi:hypothetical protein